MYSLTLIQLFQITYANNKQQELKSTFLSNKQKSFRYSLTFDEWSSTRNRRYLNLNVHTKDDFWNLGITRIHGSLPAEKCVTLVEDKLKVFIYKSTMFRYDYLFRHYI